MSIPVNKSGADLSLSLTGMRIGPRDPTTHAAKVGVKAEVYKPDHTLGSLQARIMKERTGFSGGFKIPEEFRKSKIKKKGMLSDNEQEEDLEATQQSQITKDEIFQQLNLGQSESGIGVGRHGTNSKAALAKDLVEGIEKDLEKLKRQQENLQLRKQLALTGQSIIEETAEEKERDLQYKLRSELEAAGTHVIAASPRKLQVMRHQGSQLASIKNLDLDDLEAMRAENERRLQELQEMYMMKKQNSSVGRIIRDRMGFSNNDRDSPFDKNKRNEVDFDRDEDFDTNEDLNHNSTKKKKSVRIVEEKENLFGDTNSRKELKTANFGSIKKETSETRLGRAPVTKYDKQHISITNKSRSQSRKREGQSPVQYDSPRRKLYEAKFEKYLANKDQKHKQDKKLEKMTKDDFDRYTKGPESPARSSKRFQRQSESKERRYEADSLIPKDYDERTLLQKEKEMMFLHQQSQKDPFRKLGVSNEDKMTFFLLKWIFNAIKRDSSIEDPKLKGKSYVTKQDLIKQLSKNDELMHALGYDGPQEISQAVKQSGSSKDGCLLWDEFLDFFFLRQASLQDRLDSDQWWRKIADSNAKHQSSEMIDTENSNRGTKDSPDKKNQQINIPRYSQGGVVPVDRFNYKYEDPDKKPVKMTESLKHLQDTRHQKVSQEVEDEFKSIQEKKLQEQKSQKHDNAQQQQSSLGLKKKATKQAWELTHDHLDEEELLQEQLGIMREKSQCLLLQSQIHVMKEIFETLDKYNDAILRRHQYIMALRTDERVVEFIDVDAVKVPYSNRVLTLDDVLVEIEKDEVFEMTQIGKNSTQINHKEFITWREFMTYFNDYREIEDRNRKTKEIQRTRQSLQKERQGKDGSNNSDQGVEITSLMEKEKQRRLQELPKLRPADQIDITEKQLQLLRDIFDLLPKIPGVKDTTNTIDFFIATRKNPQLRAIASAIARDPDGYSRIPRETFQQVFDRMENEVQSKQLQWATIIEYFTKRGQPLSKEEIARLIEDDRRQREEEENKKRAEEEAERRRMTRLMEDLEDKEDFEEFEMRQKSENAAKILQEKKFESDEDQYGDDQDGDYRDGRLDHDYSRDQDESDNEFDREGHPFARGRKPYRDHDDDYDQDVDGYMSDPELRTAQRNYKFGKSERGSESRKPRAKSAVSRNRRDSPRSQGKSYDERDLRNVKLTTKDYIDHERSRSRKKGKYGVTVPKPFNFDIREKSRPKSIRERKIEEMVAEKRIQEQSLLKHQFRSNPIPPEVLIPRYKTIIESNEMRRLEVKKNSVAITKQNEKPFSFYERDKQRQKPDPEEYLPHDLKKQGFKANPIPRACSVLIFDQMMRKQEQERQERIRKQAELNFSKAKLPDRMQMHAEKQKQQPFQSYSKAQPDSYSFKPKINELVTREQFKKAQDKFNQKLNKKKSQMQVTRPKSPNFTKTSNKALDREYLNEGPSSQNASMPMGMDKFKAALMKKVQQESEDKAAQNPSSTISMNLAMQKRREELEAKRKAEEAKKQEDKERFEKQQRLKNTVQSALKDRIKDDTDKKKEQLERKKKDQRDAEKETKKVIQESIKRAMARPLLVESLPQRKEASNLAKIKATKEFLEILKQNGVDPKSHLTEEQKELLAEDEYIQKRKQQLGKI